ncbi:ABC transporter substrate-binding protein [Glycomyces sp. NPDC048151]|uniref:ABC transporter substrate-binding protein n=1 Tax=Glycomyces sp. NPDC048151 TaxID=3364002 RepID=UPI00371A1E96
MKSFQPRNLASAATAALCAMGLAACGATGPGPGATASFEIGPVDLSAVCPETVVVQTDWNPQAEHGGAYQLLGPDPWIDADAKKVTGPLFSDGEYTGVDIEIRAGGPAIGFQSVVSQMYSDDSILIGAVNTDEAVQTAAEFPTTAVMAPLDKSPMMIMWDPATYPEVDEIADLKDAGATVLYYEGSSFMDYLTGAGILDEDQVDGSYDGSPANFVAAGGASAQVGFASTEPYNYEHVIEPWMKPVAYQLLHDAGFTSYKSAWTVRSGELEDNAACLEQLVPVLQRGQTDYMADPAAANAIIVDAVSAYNSGWVYGEANADFAVDLMRTDGLVGNGTDGALGSQDPARIQEIIDLLRPVFSRQGITVPDDLDPEQIATNRFIDPAIALSE